MPAVRTSLCLGLLSATLATASGNADTLRLEPLTVIGGAGRIPSMPGSAHLIDREELERQHPSDLHRALAGIPGVTVQEEEGFGLRPNISLRGTDPERSRSITALEDGVLIAPAPYSAPSIHILPPVGRLQAIEVLKGSSQIKYGPRTQGGVLNLRTTPIPETFGGRIDVSAGPDGQGKVHAHAGDAFAHGGYLVEVYQDARDGFQRLPDPAAPTGYQLRDYLAKARINTDRNKAHYHELELKISRNTQASHASYLGLAEEDFNADPYARYAASQNDRWDSERDVLQLRYAYRPWAWLDVDAAAYRQTLDRNWYKVAAAAGTLIGPVLRNPAAYPRAYAALRGLGSAADTLELEGNKRGFLAQGAQATVTVRHGWKGIRQEAEAGVRFHADSEDRREYADKWLFESGSMERVRKGLDGEKSNRYAEARAWAFHAQDHIAFGPSGPSGKFGLVPGLRFEHIEMERENWGKDLKREAPGKVDAQSVQAWAFGMGGTWQASRGLNLFAGVHQGISPPVPGNSDTADSERSLNYEAGVRSGSGPWSLEGTAFVTEYQNLLGTELGAAGGSTVSERQFNGGGVLVSGFEAAGRWEARTPVSLGLAVPLRLAYTYTRSEFRSSFTSPLEQWLTVEKGDELPYIPRHHVSAGAGLRWGRMGLDLMGKYVGEMRTVAGQGAIPRLESAGDYTSVDACAEAGLLGKAKVYAAVRNLFDEVGLAARNPAGARPTLSRSFFAGIQSGF